MTYNTLVDKIAKRAGELGELAMDELRSQYPMSTNTRSELIAYCKAEGFTKGDMIQAILNEEFELNEDREI